MRGRGIFRKDPLYVRTYIFNQQGIPANGDLDENLPKVRQNAGRVSMPVDILPVYVSSV